MKFKKYIFIALSSFLIAGCNKTNELTGPEFIELLKRNPETMRNTEFLGYERGYAILRVSKMSLTNQKKWKSEYFFTQSTNLPNNWMTNVWWQPIKNNSFPKWTTGEWQSIPGQQGDATVLMHIQNDQLGFSADGAQPTPKQITKLERLNSGDLLVTPAKDGWKHRLHSKEEYLDVYDQRLEDQKEFFKARFKRQKAPNKEGQLTP